MSNTRLVLDLGLAERASASVPEASAGRLRCCSPHGTGDAAAAVAAGELHADVHGHKLRGRLVLVRRGRDRSGKDQWLLLHKRDQYAVEGWDPADYPRSVLSGRSNDEVKADPRRVWRSDLPPAQASVPVDGTAAARGPSDDELDALGSIGRVGIWEVFGRQLRLTNLDKVLFPAADGQPSVTKREFIRYAACMAPVVLPYLAGRALNMHRFPDGADSGGFGHKQLPDHAPEWITRWDNPDADPGETRAYLVVSEPSALVWAANFGALEWHAWTSCTYQPRLPTYALIDIDPGPGHLLAGRAAARPAAPHRSAAPERGRRTQAHRAARDPDLDPHRPRRQAGSIAAKRLGRPGEFGAAQAFLCGVQAGYISSEPSPGRQRLRRTGVRWRTTNRASSRPRRSSAGCW